MDSYTWLHVLSYLVVCAAVVFYTILDGFDLGVGSLHLFAKNDEERRIFLNAIGPLWDGNEVWLIIIGGALFAAFPDVYATLFSALYTPVMILLCGIIFRAVAIEFRSKLESHKWRRIWDILFSLSSYVILICIGVAMGNLIKGIAINEERVFNGTFWDFFTLYPILVGCLSIFLFMQHGQIFLLMKTEGDLQKEIHRWTPIIFSLFIIFYVLVTIGTWMYSPYMLVRFEHSPWLWFVPVLSLVFIILMPIAIHRKTYGWGFIYSSLLILCLFSLFGIGMFPTIVRSSINPQLFSLTMFNAGASPITLKIFLTIVAIGIPLVIAYGCYLYNTFKGKVKIDSTSY